MGDETGTVSLRARDSQIDTLNEVSSRSGAVVLRNCTLELYQGKHIRLAVTKWGKLSVYPDKIASTPPPPSKINRDRNFSLIDLSVVASEMVAFPPAETYRPLSTETENQSLSSANRSQQYHATASMSRRPNPRRPPAHAKQPIQTMQPAPIYSDPSHQSTMPVRSFQGGLHGYGGVDPHAYPYPHRQQENIPAQQQLMLQQQYEMQQRQMHHMYQHQHHPQQPQQDQRLPTTSPMLPPAGVHPTASFDAAFTGAGGAPEASLPVRGTNPFLMPIHSAPPRQGPPTMTSTTSPHSQPQMDNLSSASAKMNPQAATFDPTMSTNPPRKPSDKSR